MISCKGVSYRTEALWWQRNSVGIVDCRGTLYPSDLYLRDRRRSHRGSDNSPLLIVFSANYIDQSNRNFWNVWKYFGSFDILTFEICGDYLSEVTQKRKFHHSQKILQYVKITLSDWSKSWHNATESICTISASSKILHCFYSMLSGLSKSWRKICKVKVHTKFTGTWSVMESYQILYEIAKKKRSDFSQIVFTL